MGSYPAHAQAYAALGQREGMGELPRAAAPSMRDIGRRR